MVENEGGVPVNPNNTVESITQLAEQVNRLWLAVAEIQKAFGRVASADGAASIQGKHNDLTIYFSVLCKALAEKGLVDLAAMDREAAKEGAIFDQHLARDRDPLRGPADDAQPDGR